MPSIPSNPIAEWGPSESKLNASAETDLIHLGLLRRNPGSALVPSIKSLDVQKLLSRGFGMTLDQGRQLLTGDELARLERFVFEKDQWCLLASRKLTRDMFLRIHPFTRWSDWTWKPDEMGKPHLIHPERRAQWSFNLAHTRDAVATIISSGEAVGVDLENWTRPVQYLELAKRFFSKEEYDALQAYTDHPEELQRRFFACWTLKEAFVKALGLGLRFPLDAFWMELPDNLPSTSCNQYCAIPLNWNPCLEKKYEYLTEQRWELRLWSWNPCYWVATCLGGQSKNFDITLVQAN